MLKSMMRSLRRNWYVAVFGVLLTAGLVAGMISAVPASYVSQAQMLLLPPPTRLAATGAGTNDPNALVNPYTQLGGLQSMADVIARSMMDDATVRTLRAAGVGTYTVRFDTLSAAPILLVEAEGATPKQATHAVTVLLTQVTATTARLQSQTSIAPESFIRLSVIAQPGDPQRSGKTQLRAVGAAVVVGLVLTLLMVALTDSWRVRRRTRRESVGAGPAAAAAEEAGTDAAAAEEAVTADEAPRTTEEPLANTGAGFEQ